ncbi:MAG: hypothetical protein AUK43_10795 [Oscillatoriales cyanobacterium CG2_30_40_61]|nr:MAG: hypothetical protein AUK43_10795 [Oscillatoriales cyanobacterium CG2_30_40_61]
MKEPKIQPQKPIQAAIKDLQKSHSYPSNWRERFFDTLKKKYPNFHIFYVFFNIIAMLVYYLHSHRHHVMLMRYAWFL